MRNIDRALAYAKQRGVAIPKFDNLTTDQLKARLLTEHDIKVATKTPKSILVDRLTIETLMPQLTAAQRRRIRSCDDAARTLRDRKGRKLQQRVLRNRWFHRGIRSSVR